MSRLLLSFCALLVFACTKDNNSRTLVGRWISVETFTDAALGGCNCWQIVTRYGEETLEFKANGTYSQRPPSFSSFSGCFGDYYISGDSTITWDCFGQQRIQRFYFDKSFLIIEKELTGGVAKTRYRRRSPF